MRTFVSMLVAVMLVAVSVFAQEPSVSSGGGGGASATEATATEPVMHPDSERVAQTFAGRKIKEFRDGGYAFARYENAKFSEWVQAEFEMTNMGKISYLVINGKVIVKRGNPPLDGLPPNSKGEARDFHLWLTAYADKNQPIGYGSFDTVLWLPRDSIRVQLDPVDIHILVPFMVPNGVDSKNLRLQVSDKYNSSYSYNEYAHGFDVWVDPLSLLSNTKSLTFQPISPTVEAR